MKSLMERQLNKYNDNFCKIRQGRDYPVLFCLRTRPPLDSGWVLKNTLAKLLVTVLFIIYNMSIRDIILTYSIKMSLCILCY